MNDTEIVRYMANCIRRFCEEQVCCDCCPFVDEKSGKCGICGVPMGWEGYEEKTEFEIVAKNATTTCGNISDCTEDEVNCVECSTVAKNATVQRIELVEE